MQVESREEGARFVVACETPLRNIGGGARCVPFAPVDALLGCLVNLSSNEREIGTVETCYLNLGCPLVECKEDF